MAKGNAARKDDGDAMRVLAENTSAPKLDRLIHERLRLGILSALAVNDSLTFNELKKLMETTDGNLSVHARKLEDAGYISCGKSFDGRECRRTEYRLTPGGAQRVREISRSHGSVDPGHAQDLRRHACRDHHGWERPLGSRARGLPRVARTPERRGRGAANHRSRLPN